MAKKKDTGPSTIDDVFDEETFRTHYGRFREYNEGVETVDGVPMSKAKRRSDELQGTIQDLKDEHMSEIREAKGMHKREYSKVEKAVFELGKKAYLKRHGHDHEPKDLEGLRENIESFIADIASQATGKRLTYEQAVHEISQAKKFWVKNPERGEQSDILEALYQVTAAEYHDEQRKVDRVKRKLSNPYFKPHFDNELGKGKNVAGMDSRPEIKKATITFKPATTPLEYLAALERFYVAENRWDLPAPHFTYKPATETELKRYKAGGHGQDTAGQGGKDAGHGHS